ncbi:S-layer glycoprotein N-glycosyltransferase AglJ [Natronomonas sp. EA1]|uniref:S-layer glycoprotein N-glycosyltransferase AglJ n=1 Tax=Natronomonas sp. EA1 TaxID=3421655 RepID=UPI003EBFA870
MDHDDVCVLLPTLNEAETIGDVIDGFRAEGFDHFLVVDGHSTDATREIAADHGARVIEQSGKGKGQAVREGVRHVEREVVLMADGDGTYRPEDATAMLEPIFAGRANHVIGDRFADMEEGAMTKLNGVGNRLINRAFALIHGRNLRDILSGYRAFTVESFERYTLSADGFGIETELAVECVRHNTPTEVVDITYLARPGGSETNLNPLTDGGRIILTLYRLAKTNNPLFYFGSVGAVGIVIGLGFGAYVLYDYLARGISHEAMAVVGTFSILLGVQLVMFGFLSEIIVAINREQRREIESLSKTVEEALEATGDPDEGTRED